MGFVEWKAIQKMLEGVVLMTDDRWFRYGYKEWILKKIQIDHIDDWLFDILHGTHFIYSVERDRHRYTDGISLRNNYFKNRESLKPMNFDDIPCSCLEMLAALAIRIDDEWLGNPNNPRPEIIFLKMLENIGLKEGIEKSRENEERIKRLLMRWLGRCFDRDGQMSTIFPSKRNRNYYFRDMEIWDQMQLYISENF